MKGQCRTIGETRLRQGCPIYNVVINFAIRKICQNLTTLLVKSYHVETDRTKLKLKILQKFKHFINILNPIKQGRYKEHSALSDKEICSSCLGHNMGI